MNQLLFLIGTVFIVGLVAQRQVRAAGPGYKIIANPDVPVAQMTPAELEAIFLKKTTRWRNGATCAPADLPMGNVVREAFSTKVLKRGSKAVHAYWQQRIFTGQGAPPQQLQDDAAMIAYVARTPGAIAYVGEGAAIANVRIITVAE